MLPINIHYRTVCVYSSFNNFVFETTIRIVCTNAGDLGGPSHRLWILLTPCIKDVHSRFDWDFYGQINCVAMGNAIGPF